jgi:DNA processing protein
MARSPAEIPDAVLRLALCSEVGPAFHHAALARFGSWEAVLDAPAAELASVGRLPATRVDAVHAQLRTIDPDLERIAMERAGARAVVLGDPDYPPLLAPVPQPPIMLWVRGRSEAAGEDAVGIVGARRATAYGTAQSARFSSALAASGIAIVSGGARGIDAEAHRAALRVGGTTVAVLGCGLGEPYPPEHVRLYEEIVDAGGLLVSEFPMGWPPIASNFPRRNRIISGLSLTVVVVEAGLASGALITARHAIDDHRREPCAVPGPVDSSRSAGCNAAIRDGWVHVALGPDDVLRLLDENAERMGRPAGVRPDLAGLGVPEELRSTVVRAAELMARRPRIGAEDLAASLGVPDAESRRARTFAELLLAQAAAARRRRRGARPSDGQFQPMA